MSKILPCPFCNGEGRMGLSAEPVVYVVCSRCATCGPLGERKDDAIAVWNRRTPQPVTPAGGEVLRMEIQPKGHGYKSHTLRVHIGDQSFMVGSGPGFDSREEAEWMALFLEAAIEKLHPSPDADRFQWIVENCTVNGPGFTYWHDSPECTPLDERVDAALNQRGD